MVSHNHMIMLLKNEKIIHTILSINFFYVIHCILNDNAYSFLLNLLYKLLEMASNNNNHIITNEVM